MKKVNGRPNTSEFSFGNLRPMPNSGSLLRPAMLKHASEFEVWGDWSPEEQESHQNLEGQNAKAENCPTI